MFFTNHCFAQIPNLTDTSFTNFNFNTYYAKTKRYYDSTSLDTVKGSGYKDFIRWAWFWNTRIGYDSANNNDGSLKSAYQAYIGQLNKSAILSKAGDCNTSVNNKAWSYIGHTGIGATGPSSRGKGRINKIKVDPNDNRKVYLGSNKAGLWVCENIADTDLDKPEWKNLTDGLNMPILGINDIEIDPNNSNIIYIVTGTLFGLMPGEGIGLLKSLDGGQTWKKTGLTNVVSDEINHVGTDICLAKDATGNYNIVLVGWNNRIFRSSNGGNTFEHLGITLKPVLDMTLTPFNKKSQEQLHDMEVLPTEEDIIIASTGNFRSYQAGKNCHLIISNDRGENWTDITDLLRNFSNPAYNITDAATKIDIAVTIVDNYTRIYVAVVGVISDKTRIYVSDDNGQSFVWKGDMDFTAHNYHDMVVNPTDYNKLILADIDGIRKVKDQGATPDWTLPGNKIHVDEQDLEIINHGNGNFTLLNANDGGIWSSENATSDWVDKNGITLNISEFYTIDIDETNGMIAGGAQDMGIYARTNNTWKNTPIGDGYTSITDPYNHRIYINSQSYNPCWPTNYCPFVDFHTVHPDGSVTLWDFSIESDMWTRPYALDDKRLYMVAKNKLLFKDKNTLSTGAWTDVLNANHHNNDGEHRQHITSVAVAPSNPNIMYIAYNKGTQGVYNSAGKLEQRFYICTTARTNPVWIDRTSNLHAFNSWIGATSIVVDPTSSLRVWVAFGGFNNGEKVYFSNNGGVSWKNISIGLPNFPINSLVFQRGSDNKDVLYCGTDVGVYYLSVSRNDMISSSTSNITWQCFNKDFPTAVVTSLKINNCSQTIVASTYGRGIWEAPLAEIFTSNLAPVITANTEWVADNPQIFYDNVIVNPGVTLTIRSTVSFGAGKKLIIKAGAKVIINGGKLTSICPDKYWGGVQLEGNKNLNQQVISNQGFLQMINATIEKAYNGVSIIGLNSAFGADWGKTGGIIQANGSYFLNNKRDIEFLSYHPMVSGTERPNRSFFINCRFQTTNSSIFSSSVLSAHVTMYDVNGVRFLGCVFEDLRTPLSPTSQIEHNKLYGRTGIYTIESNYSVNNYCTIYPCSGNPSQFINMKRAIESRTDGKMGIISIENSVFSSYTGVFLLSISKTPTVRTNTFTINHWTGPLTNTDFPFGLYLDLCQNFNIEGNQFTGTTIAANVANGGSAGLVIRNTGANDNEFYRNYFDNVKMASQALSENREKGLVYGLRFRCNDYEQNFNDLDVRVDPLIPGDPLLLGMAWSQGQKPSGPPVLLHNKFGNNSAILNKNMDNRGNWIEYIYSGLANASNRFYPNTVTTNVNRYPFTQNEYCPNRINSWGIDRAPILTNLGNIKPAMMVKVIQQKGLTDGGNTHGLLNDINNANNSNVNTVFNQLLLFSPYLSEEVLALISNKDLPFTSTMITDVLLANPQSSRSLSVQTNLNNRINPISAASREAIDNLVGVYTYRDTLGWEVSALVQDYDINFSELVYSFLTDSNSTLNEVSPWLKHPINPTYHYQLAEMYFDNNEWENFLAITDSIPLKFELDSREQSFHTAFTLLYNQLHTWQLAEANLFEPDSLRKNWLLNFISNNTIYPVRVHGLLAVNDILISQPDVYVNSDNSGGQGKRSLDDENDKSMVSLYPNPGTNEVTLKWKEEFRASTVKVFDINGKFMLGAEWKNKGTLTIKVETFPNGIYFVNIETIAKDKITRKLLINR